VAAAVITVLAVAPEAWADLKAALAEPNLEKRSGLALDNASTSLSGAREAYNKGDATAVKERLKECRDSVDLAYQSLLDTHKDPRRSPKWFKRAEMETRELVRRLQSLSADMSFGDRPDVDAVQSRVQEVHDNLLQGIMEGKKK
jgi:hypothetical protein